MIHIGIVYAENEMIVILTEMAMGYKERSKYANQNHQYLLALDLLLLLPFRLGFMLLLGFCS